MEEQRDNKKDEQEVKIVSYLKDHSVPLTTVSPQETNSDLLPLKDVIGSAVLVGLGEATHGNKEFSQVKHRMLKFLIEEMDFDGLIMEVPQEPAKKIDEYIKTGEGDPIQLLSDLGYWITRTQEVLDMIEWMKEYNANSKGKKINFYGCDVPVDDEKRTDASGIQRDKAMADNCLSFLNQDGKQLKLALWAHNTHIANRDRSSLETMGSFLKASLGEQYVNLGMLFGEGSFIAVRGDFKAQQLGKRETFAFSKPPDDSYAKFFQEAGNPLLVIDLRLARTNHLFEDWKDYTYTVREVGSAFDPAEEATFSQKTDLANKFDGIFWIKNVTPSTVLKYSTLDNMEAVLPESNPEKLPTPVLVKTISIGKDAVAYDIQNEGGMKIGYIALMYFPDTETVMLAGINIEESERGKGYGKAVYEQIPSLQPPIKGNYTFVSDRPDLVSSDAKRVWESLVKEGKAFLREDGCYQMIDKSKK